MNKLLNNAFTVGVVVLAGFVLFRVLSPRLFPVATPAVFAEATTLTAAIDQAKASGKPVFAVATASWCAPCQGYKKGALSNDQVAAWLTENTIPVFIDVDDNPDAATSLSVSSIPATFLLNAQGEITARATGLLSSRKLIDWLDANTNTEQTAAGS